MSNYAIDVRKLSKSFAGKIAVDNVAIQQPKGSVWGFLGPNGSGKTTCIRMLCGLLKPDVGEGHCLGFDVVHESRAIKRQTGYMTQKFSFWTDLTVRENLDFVAQLYRLDKRHEQVEAQMEMLGLTQRQHELCASLSGGWKQRLALAAVTIHHPKLLLLDEPTAGVDPQVRRTFWQMIHHLSEHNGITVLVATHYMDDAERCDSIVYLAYGKVLIQGRIDEVIRQSGLAARYSQPDNSLRQYLPMLQKMTAVDSANFYNNCLHISGKNALELDRALKQHLPQLQWRSETPSLDDVFVALEQSSGGDQR